jgi:hypothetical protein
VTTKQLAISTSQFSQTRADGTAADHGHVLADKPIVMSPVMIPLKSLFIGISINQGEGGERGERRVRSLLRFLVVK